MWRAAAGLDVISLEKHQQKWAKPPPGEQSSWDFHRIAAALSLMAETSGTHSASEKASPMRIPLEEPLEFRPLQALLVWSQAGPLGLL